MNIAMLEIEKPTVKEPQKPEGGFVPATRRMQASAHLYVPANLPTKAEGFVPAVQRLHPNNHL